MNHKHMKKAIGFLIVAILCLAAVLLMTSRFGKYNMGILDIGKAQASDSETDERYDAASEPVEEAEPSELPESVSTPAPSPEPEEEQKKTADLSAYTFDDTLASVYSHVSGSDEARINNINKAIEKLDGTVIMPGETFSFNETVGAIDAEHGYENAQIYNDGGRYPNDEVYETGGGVNQLASTLYCASIYGVLDPVERYPHNFWLTGNGYLKRGRDAYVCNNGENETRDLKIKNSYDSPVMIKAWLDDDGDKLHVELYGTNPTGLRAEPYDETISHYLQSKPDVCCTYEVHNFRNVYDNKGLVRTDDLNLDLDGDGEPDYDFYQWHEEDYVWT